MNMGVEMKRTKWFSGLAILAFFLAFSGVSEAKGKLGGITVNSEPTKAQCLVNGKSKGETPVTMGDLPSGKYVVELRKDGYTRTYKEVSLLEGQRLNVEVSLEPITGLLLVESSPEGADVAIDGVSKGITPLLISDLKLGTYRISLKSAELLPKTVEVNLTGRTPQGVFVELDSNTARLSFTSSPDGAEVRIDGVLVGTTPFTAPEVKAGEATITITKAGYRPYERKMMLEATKPYEVGAQLEALPSGLSISSEPDGAIIFVDNREVGKAPVNLDNLADGPHEVVAKMVGFSTQTKTIYLEPSVSESVEFKMVKDSGQLVLSTEPANVQVFIGGKMVTTTQAKDGSDSISAPLRLSLKSDQFHTLQFVRDGFVPKTIKVQPAVDEVVTQHVVLKRIFVYDTKITTRTGVIKCRLEDRLPNGDLYYERFPGIYGTTRAKDILDVKPITLDDEANKAARDQIQKSRESVPE